MTLVKALVGGLIGGGVGGCLSTLLQPMLKSNVPWGVLLVGLFAGLGARLLGGQNRNFTTGLVSAVSAIAAVIGISYFNSQAIIRGAEDPSKPAIVLTQAQLEEMAAEEDEEEAAEADTAPTEGTDAGDDDTGDDDSSDHQDADPELTEASDNEDEAGDEPKLSLEAKAVMAEMENTAKVKIPNRSKTKDGSMMEMILNCASALLAFLLGSGGGGNVGEQTQ